jgi:predicted TIM-barrel fold metal-dependent hydrolase
MGIHTSARSTIADKINSTLFIDTHEHLLEESQRLAGPAAGAPLFTCDDWAYLFVHYAMDDLIIAGMSQADTVKFSSSELSPKAKWDLFAPYWPYIRNTGYGKAVLISIQRLFDEEDVNADSVERITAKLRAQVQKGYYAHVLHDVAGVESCQVNSLDRTFRVTEYPDLLFQDIGTLPLSSELDLDTLRRDTGLPINTLHECYEAIDWYFESYGQQAIATKNQSAYSRRLDYANVSAEDAAPIFKRLAGGQELSTAEHKALRDHLWRYTVTKATAYNLPVKLHTGYYAGTGYMPLDRVSQNLKDLCPILQDFPTTKFVLMHITYPYQDELIALAKQYANVYVDLCWAWIVNPAVTTRFVKEFLMAVPANKIFTFGGDYTAVENVVGHAAIARHGLTQALSELVDEEWLTENEALALVEPLMRGNAWNVFRLAEKTAHARQTMKEK